MKLEVENITRQIVVQNLETNWRSASQLFFVKSIENAINVLLKQDTPDRLSEIENAKLQHQRGNDCLLVFRSFET